MRSVLFPIGIKKWSTKGAHLLARHSRPQKVKPHLGLHFFDTDFFPIYGLIFGASYCNVPVCMVRLPNQSTVPRVTVVA